MGTLQLEHFPVRNLNLIQRVPLDKSSSSMGKKFKFRSIFVALFSTHLCVYREKHLWESKGQHKVFSLSALASLQR